MEAFRLAFNKVTSLSQEVLRAFLFALRLLVPEALLCSASSSDEARASESGVERRNPGLDFSRRREAEAGCVPKVPKAGIGARVDGPGLVGALLMMVKRT